MPQIAASSPDQDFGNHSVSPLLKSSHPAERGFKMQGVAVTDLEYAPKADCIRLNNYKPKT